MAEAEDRLADLQGAEHEGHARAGQAHDHRQDRDQPQLPEKALEQGFHPFLQGGLRRWSPDGGSPTRGPGAWEGLGCTVPARVHPHSSRSRRPLGMPTLENGRHRPWAGLHPGLLGFPARPVHRFACLPARPAHAVRCATPWEASGMGGADPVAGRAGRVRSQCRSAELSARETELQSVPSLNFELFRCYRIFARIPQ